jgi:hypothetical protein
VGALTADFCTGGPTAQPVSNIAAMDTHLFMGRSPLEKQDTPV